MALPTEAWRGAEIRRRSAENSYVDLPGPVTCEVTFLYSKFAVKAASQPEKSTLTGTWGQCYKNTMVNYRGNYIPSFSRVKLTLKND